MFRKVLEAFKKMKREGLLLWFVVGLYLLYTASGVFRNLGNETGNRMMLCVFIVLFAVVGIVLFALCGYFLLRLFYLNIYLEQQEAEQAKLEAAGGLQPEQPGKKKSGTEKYLEFMFRIFRIKE
jgi:hypothetical protein